MSRKTISDDDIRFFLGGIPSSNTDKIERRTLGRSPLDMSPEEYAFYKMTVDKAPSFTAVNSKQFNQYMNQTYV